MINVIGAKEILSSMINILDDWVLSMPSLNNENSKFIVVKNWFI